MLIDSLDNRLIAGLSQIYDAERLFLSAQQEMLPRASAEALRATLEDHIVQTQQQIWNLERVLSLFGTVQPVRSDAANGLVLEGQLAMRQADTSAIMDSVIADAMVKVEHYEIASYRSLLVAAEQIGQPDIITVLQQNLEQEEQTARRVEQQLPTIVSMAARTRAAGSGGSF